MDLGQLRRLHKDLIAGPQRCEFESGVWTAPLLAIHLKKKYGVKYVTNWNVICLHCLLDFDNKHT